MNIITILKRVGKKRTKLTTWKIVSGLDTVGLEAKGALHKS